MKKPNYFPPVTEIIEVQAEQAIFSLSAEGFTDENYNDLLGGE